MSNPTQEIIPAILNPSRMSVRNLTQQALNDSEGDPAQVFADIIMTAATIAAMADIDVSDVQLIFNQAMPNATIAAEYIMAKIGAPTDVG